MKIAHLEASDKISLSQGVLKNIFELNLKMRKLTAEPLTLSQRNLHDVSLVIYKWFDEYRCRIRLLKNDHFSLCLTAIWFNYNLAMVLYQHYVRLAKINKSQRTPSQALSLIYYFANTAFELCETTNPLRTEINKIIKVLQQVKDFQLTRHIKPFDEISYLVVNELRFSQILAKQSKDHVFDALFDLSLVYKHLNNFDISLRYSYTAMRNLIDEYHYFIGLPKVLISTITLDMSRYNKNIWSSIQQHLQEKSLTHKPEVKAVIEPTLPTIFASAKSFTSLDQAIAFINGQGYVAFYPTEEDYEQLQILHVILDKGGSLMSRPPLKGAYHPVTLKIEGEFYANISEYYSNEMDRFTAIKAHLIGTEPKFSVMLTYCKYLLDNIMNHDKKDLHKALSDEISKVKNTETYKDYFHSSFHADQSTYPLIHWLQLLSHAVKPATRIGTLAELRISLIRCLQINYRNIVEEQVRAHRLQIEAHQLRIRQTLAEMEVLKSQLSKKNEKYVKIAFKLAIRKFLTDRFVAQHDIAAHLLSKINGAEFIHYLRNYFTQMSQGSQAISARAQELATLLEQHEDILLSEEEFNDIQVLLREVACPLAIEKDPHLSKVMNVKGYNVHLRKIFDNPLLCNIDVQEVKILAKGYIIFDENVNWPGKNLVIIARGVLFSRDCKIDLSGRDMANLPPSKTKALSGKELAQQQNFVRADNQTIGMSGEDGLDGKAGASAGNFLLECNEESDLGLVCEKLQVVANGGRGQDGQHGGDGDVGIKGKDGADGKLPDNTSVFHWRMHAEVAKGKAGVVGKPGGRGGRLGLGGEGGKAGDVVVICQQKIYSLKRAENSDGQVGVDGAPGKGGEGGQGGYHGVDHGKQWHGYLFGKKVHQDTRGELEVIDRNAIWWFGRPSKELKAIKTEDEYRAVRAMSGTQGQQAEAAHERYHQRQSAEKQTIYSVSDMSDIMQNHSETIDDSISQDYQAKISKMQNNLNSKTHQQQILTHDQKTLEEQIKLLESQLNEVDVLAEQTINQITQEQMQLEIESEVQYTQDFNKDTIKQRQDTAFLLRKGYSLTPQFKNQGEAILTECLTVKFAKFSTPENSSNDMLSKATTTISHIFKKGMSYLESALSREQKKPPILWGSQSYYHHIAHYLHFEKNMPLDEIGSVHENVFRCTVNYAVELLETIDELVQNASHAVNLTEYAKIIQDLKKLSPQNVNQFSVILKKLGELIAITIKNDNDILISQKLFHLLCTNPSISEQAFPSENSAYYANKLYIFIQEYIGNLNIVERREYLDIFFSHDIKSNKSSLRLFVDRYFDAKQKEGLLSLLNAHETSSYSSKELFSVHEHSLSRYVIEGIFPLNSFEAAIEAYNKHRTADDLTRILTLFEESLYSATANNAGLLRFRGQTAVDILRTIKTIITQKQHPTKYYAMWHQTILRTIMHAQAFPLIYENIYIHLLSLHLLMTRKIQKGIINELAPTPLSKATIAQADSTVKPVTNRIRERKKNSNEIPKTLPTDWPSIRQEAMACLKLNMPEQLKTSMVSFLEFLADYFTMHDNQTEAPVLLLTYTAKCFETFRAKDLSIMLKLELFETMHYDVELAHKLLADNSEAPEDTFNAVAQLGIEISRLETLVNSLINLRSKDIDSIDWAAINRLFTEIAKTTDDPLNSALEAFMQNYLHFVGLNYYIKAILPASEISKLPESEVLQLREEALTVINNMHARLPIFKNIKPTFSLADLYQALKRATTSQSIANFKGNIELAWLCHNLEYYHNKNGGKNVDLIESMAKDIVAQVKSWNAKGINDQKLHKAFSPLIEQLIFTDEQLWELRQTYPQEARINFRRHTQNSFIIAIQEKLNEKNYPKKQLAKLIQIINPTIQSFDHNATTITYHNRRQFFINLINMITLAVQYKPLKYKLMQLAMSMELKPTTRQDSPLQFKMSVMKIQDNHLDLMKQRKTLENTFFSKFEELIMSTSEVRNADDVVTACKYAVQMTREHISKLAFTQKQEAETKLHDFLEKGVTETVAQRKNLKIKEVINVIEEKLCDLANNILLKHYQITEFHGLREELKNHVRKIQANDYIGEPRKHIDIISLLQECMKIDTRILNHKYSDLVNQLNQIVLHMCVPTHHDLSGICKESKEFIDSNAENGFVKLAEFTTMYNRLNSLMQCEYQENYDVLYNKEEQRTEERNDALENMLLTADNESNKLHDVVRDLASLHSSFNQKQHDECVKECLEKIEEITAYDESQEIIITTNLIKQKFSVAHETYLQTVKALAVDFDKNTDILSLVAIMEKYLKQHQDSQSSRSRTLLILVVITGAWLDEAKTPFVQFADQAKAVITLVINLLKNHTNENEIKHFADIADKTFTSLSDRMISHVENLHFGEETNKLVQETLDMSSQIFNCFKNTQAKAQCQLEFFEELVKIISNNKSDLDETIEHFFKKKLPTLSDKVLKSLDTQSQPTQSSLNNFVSLFSALSPATADFDTMLERLYIVLAYFPAELNDIIVIYASYFHFYQQDFSSKSEGLEILDNFKQLFMIKIYQAMIIEFGLLEEEKALLQRILTHLLSVNATSKRIQTVCDCFQGKAATEDGNRLLSYVFATNDQGVVESNDLVRYHKAENRIDYDLKAIQAFFHQQLSRILDNDEANILKMLVNINDSHSVFADIIDVLECVSPSEWSYHFEMILQNQLFTKLLLCADVSYKSLSDMRVAIHSEHKDNTLIDFVFGNEGQFSELIRPLILSYQHDDAQVSLFKRTVSRYSEHLRSKKLYSESAENFEKLILQVCNLRYTLNHLYAQADENQQNQYVSQIVMLIVKKFNDYYAHQHGSTNALNFFQELLEIVGENCSLESACAIMKNSFVELWINNLYFEKIQNILSDYQNQPNNDQEKSIKENTLRTVLSQIAALKPQTDIMKLFYTKLKSETQLIDKDARFSLADMQALLTKLTSLTQRSLGLHPSTWAVLKNTALENWLAELRREDVMAVLPLTINDDQLTQLVRYILQIERRYGSKIVDSFLSLINKILINQDIKIVDYLIAFTEEISRNKWLFNLEVIALLAAPNVQIENWRNIMIDYKTKQQQKKLDTHEIVSALRIVSENDYQTLLDDVLEIQNSIQSHIPFKLDNKESFKELLGLHKNSDAVKPKRNMPLKDWRKSEIRYWLIYVKHKNANDKSWVQNNVNQILAVLCQGVWLTTQELTQHKAGYYPRETQLVALLVLLNSQRKQRGMLGQIATGEGKTLIASMFAVVQGLLGRNVNILTSSEVLADRDSKNEQNVSLYKLFGLTVSNNCDAEAVDNEDVRKSRYRASIVYGVIASFQRDILLSEFFNSSVMSGRSNEVILIDEVDNMMLDRAESVLYLSHNIADLRHLRRLYVEIWAGVNAKDVQVCTLEDKLNLVEAYVLKRHEEKAFTLPHYLVNFFKQRLRRWIESALTAKLLDPGNHYKIDAGGKTEGDTKIVVMDKDTGVEQLHTQWNSGLHQFLQLKHSQRLENESLKAIFISNYSYFKRYPNDIFGITGTLGSLSDTNLLQNVYQVDYFVLPRYKQYLFLEEPAYLSENLQMWYAEISREIEEKIEQGRAVLIICDNTLLVDDIYKILSIYLQRKEKVASTDQKPEIHKYTSAYEQFSIGSAERPLKSGDIIIATNLAGRGTDLLLSDELKKRGGLHVVLSYLPKNSRIEMQAFGRAARKGDEGSGKFIIIAEGKANIDQLKQIRDDEEAQRVEIIRTRNLQIVALEEKLSVQFAKLYKHAEAELKGGLLDKLKSKFGSLGNGYHEIQLESLKDEWSFWLDTMAESIQAVNLLSEEAILSSFDEFEAQTKAILNKEDVIKFAKSPHALVKLGKYFMRKNSFHHATACFQKCVELEPDFSEIAHYYFVCAKFKVNNVVSLEDRRTVKMHLQHSQYLMTKRIDDLANIQQYVHLIRNAAQKEELGKEKDLLKQQIEEQCKIWGVYLDNIDKILGSEFNEESLNFFVEKETLKQKVFKRLIENKQMVSDYRISKKLEIKTSDTPPNKSLILTNAFKEKVTITIPDDFSQLMPDVITIIEKYMRSPAQKLPKAIYDNAFLDIVKKDKDIKAEDHDKVSRLLWVALKNQGVIKPRKIRFPFNETSKSSSINDNVDRIQSTVKNLIKTICQEAENELQEAANIRKKAGANNAQAKKAYEEVEKRVAEIKLLNDFEKPLTDAVTAIVGKLKTTKKITISFDDLVTRFSEGEFPPELKEFSRILLDQLLVFDEYKSKLFLILSIVAVAILGVLEIVAGVLLTVFTLGLGATIGNMLIAEGVGDLIYSITSALTGQFSWKHYAIQKAISVVITVATVGIGAYIKGGTAALQVGKGVAEMAAKKVAEEGAKAIAKKVVARVAIEVGKGVALAAANVAIDNIFAALPHEIMVNFEKKIGGMVNNALGHGKHYDHLNRTINEYLSVAGSYESSMNVVRNEFNKIMEAKHQQGSSVHNVINLAGLVASEAASKITMFITKSGNAGQYKTVIKLIGAAAAIGIDILVEGAKIVHAVHQLSSVFDDLATRIAEITAVHKEQLGDSRHEVSETTKRDVAQFITGCQNQLTQEMITQVSKSLSTGLARGVNHAIIAAGDKITDKAFAMIAKDSQKITSSIANEERGMAQQQSDGYSSHVSDPDNKNQYSSSQSNATAEPVVTQQQQPKSKHKHTKVPTKSQRLAKLSKRMQNARKVMTIVSASISLGASIATLGSQMRTQKRLNEIELALLKHRLMATKRLAARKKQTLQEKNNLEAKNREADLKFIQEELSKQIKDCQRKQETIKDNFIRDSVILLRTLSQNVFKNEKLDASSTILSVDKELFALFDSYKSNTPFANLVTNIKQVINKYNYHLKESALKFLAELDQVERELHKFETEFSQQLVMAASYEEQLLTMQQTDRLNDQDVLANLKMQNPLFNRLQSPYEQNSSNAAVYLNFVDNSYTLGSLADISVQRTRQFSSLTAVTNDGNKDNDLTFDTISTITVKRYKVLQALSSSRYFYFSQSLPQQNKTPIIAVKANSPKHKTLSNKQNLQKIQDNTAKIVGEVASAAGNVVEAGINIALHQQKIDTAETVAKAETAIIDNKVQRSEMKQAATLESAQREYSMLANEREHDRQEKSADRAAEMTKDDLIRGFKDQLIEKERIDFTKDENLKQAVLDENAQLEKFAREGQSYMQSGL